jgi:hypothetical protein
MQKCGPFICHGLEIDDLAFLNSYAAQHSGETIIDNLYVPSTNEEKIEVLAEIICRAGDEPSAALLVLMATLENAASESTRECSKALRLNALRSVEHLRYG